MTAIPHPIASATPDDGRRVWLLALAGAATMFVVQPPADLWWLAWLAPLPWLALVTTSRLDGPHPWLAIWIGGFADVALKRAAKIADGFIFADGAGDATKHS